MDLKIAVGVPTFGRAHILRDTLLQIAEQDRRPDLVIVCGTRVADLEGAALAMPDVVLLLAEAGLSRQRNAIFAAAQSVDVVMFFDDDFLPEPHYLSAIERHMTSDLRIVVATGRVLADG